jgi:hypothetical protein
MTNDHKTTIKTFWTGLDLQSNFYGASLCSLPLPRYDLLGANRTNYGDTSCITVGASQGSSQPLESATTVKHNWASQQTFLPASNPSTIHLKASWVKSSSRIRRQRDCRKWNGKGSHFRQPWESHPRDDLWQARFQALKAGYTVSTCSSGVCSDSSSGTIRRAEQTDCKIISDTRVRFPTFSSRSPQTPPPWRMKEEQLYFETPGIQIV